MAENSTKCERNDRLCSPEDSNLSPPCGLAEEASVPANGGSKSTFPKAPPNPTNLNHATQLPLWAGNSHCGNELVSKYLNLLKKNVVTEKEAHGVGRVNRNGILISNETSREPGSSQAFLNFTAE